jgi:hypothetical protein
MDKVDIFNSTVPPAHYLRSKKEVKTFRKVSGEPAEKRYTKIEKVKPQGTSAIVRTIKVENNINERHALRSYLFEQLVSETYNLNDNVRLSIKGASMHQDLVGHEGVIKAVDIDQKMATIEWDNGETKNLAFDYIEPIRSIEG